jgi:transposase
LNPTYARTTAAFAEIVAKGPLAHRYNTNVWTAARIAELIRSEVAVNYHRDHIGRWMHRLNWSHPKPE